MFKYLSLICLLAAPIALAMDESKEPGVKATDSSLTFIKTWKDITPFAGKIVAYKAIGDYYAPEGRYSVDTDVSLIYGYVEKEISNWSGWSGRSHHLAHGLEAAAPNGVQDRGARP